MPTYQYTCTECGESLEAVQSFTDDPLTECPACSGRLRKVFSAVGVVFKGSGFYRNDSRNGDNAKKSSGSGSSGSSDSTSSSTSADTSSSGSDSSTSDSSSTKSDSSSSTTSTASTPAA